MTDELNEPRSRRAIISAGAAAAAGGLIIVGAGKASAANGDPLRLGQGNTASSPTTVNASGNTDGFRVNNTNTGSSANGIVASARNGYGMVVASTGHTGGKIYTKSATKHGLFAQNTATTSSSGTAIYAQHNSPGAGAAGASAIRGVQGPGADSALVDTSPVVWPAAAEFAGAVGVLGKSPQEGGIGAAGINHSSGGFGVVAANNAGGYALYAVIGRSYLGGDTHVGGTLTKNGGAFRIDHPLDPANTYLSHSFVESPDMMNVYNGVAELDGDGAATIELPEWFEALNRDFRYQLTPIGAAAPNLHVSAEVDGNAFSVAGGVAGIRVSWQLTGIRQDAWAEKNRIPVEHAKPDDEKGTYLFPEGFGKPHSAGIAAARALGTALTQAPTS